MAEKAASEGGFGGRFRELIFVWKKTFLQNWALFRASKIGVVGLAIMLTFVILAVSAPFMGLRDPIRFVAPDEDLIDVHQQWIKDSLAPGEELVASPPPGPFTGTVAYRVLPDNFETQTDRLYAAAGDRVYAMRVRGIDGGQNAWGSFNYYNVSRDDGVTRAITAGPLIINYGDFSASGLGDFEVYVGTNDGAVFIFQDQEGNIVLPQTLGRIELGSSITGLAAFNTDDSGPEAVRGFAEHASSDNGVSWATDRITSSVNNVDEGEYISIATNASGGVHVAFYDLWNQRPINATLVGSGWQFDSPEPSSTLDIGRYTSLRIGTDGRQRMAYADETSHALTFAFVNVTGRWVANYVNDTEPVAYTSLSLSGGDMPSIAYHGETSDKLLFTRWNGTVWENFTVDDGGEQASLAINSSGNPGIAYLSTMGGLRFAEYDGTNWASSPVDPDVRISDPDRVGRHVSLAYDAADRPSIAYYNQTDGDLRFTRRTGGVWSSPEYVDLTGDVGAYPSLAMNSSGVPAIAYHDATNRDLRYAQWNGSGWPIRTVASAGSTGIYPSLAFESNDRAHIGFHSLATGRTDRDLLVAGTAEGIVAAVEVSIPKTLQYVLNDEDPGNPHGERSVLAWDYRIRWTANLGSEIHLAAGPLTSISKVPLGSPAFGANGSAVFVGTLNGTLHALKTSDGTPLWLESDNRTERTIRVGNPWRTAPVVATPGEGPFFGIELVYGASSFLDHNNDSFEEAVIYAALAGTGEILPTWRDRFQEYDGGLRVFSNPEREIPDEGNLTQPTIRGNTIYVGSSSGRLYNIARDASGEGGETALPEGSIRWIFQDGALVTQGFRSGFVGAPLSLDERGLVLVNANHDNGTTDPTDDLGIAYSLNADAGNISWKRTLPAPVSGGSSSYTPVDAIEPASDWLVYGRVHPTRGLVTGVISFYVSGSYLAPSPPSWAYSHKCPPEKQLPPGSMCPGYPSGNTYLLGLDSQGRDIFSQVIWGSRIALLVGFMAAFFTVLLGVVVGLVAGYSGGKVESILMRFTDVILVLPGLPLIIALAAVLGVSIWNIILVIALLGWPGIARIIRAEVLSLKERPFIDSARVTGASTTRIVFKHIAPNVLPLAFLYMTFAVSGAILSEAALSFIGLGDVNTMSWGIMLQLVSQSKALTAWWWLLPPGLAITLISLSFFLVGRAFDEIVNPRLRKR